MSTYVIGDIQGCYKELLALLDKINFDEQKDRVWFVGDLVNRGPLSLEVLRFVKQLDNNVIIVLGNHDLHLLAVANQTTQKRKKDTLDSVLEAPDREILLDWLRKRPLFHYDEELGFALIHAGLPPQWDIQQVSEHAKELETVLQGNHYRDFIQNMYGDTPNKWSENLSERERLRYIVNCFTRMRYCDDESALNLTEKGPPGSQLEPYQPWFTLSSRKTRDTKIIFGHWSTVSIGNIKDFSDFNVYPLDTGCVWGIELTALRLEDMRLFSVPSQQKRKKFN